MELWQLTSWARSGHYVVNFFLLVEVSVSIDSSWDLARNITCSPRERERTKGPWLRLMTTFLLFSLLWLFSFVSTFLTSLTKLILWLKFSTDKRQAENIVAGGGARTVGSCSVSLCLLSTWPGSKSTASYNRFRCLVPRHTWPTAPFVLHLEGLILWLCFSTVEILDCAMSCINFPSRTTEP